MSYNIEDYIDDFMVHVGDAGDNVGVLRKASRYLRTFKDQRRLANQLQEIKTQVIEAGERRKRYMLDQCIPNTTRVTIDPRLSTLYQKSENLVGIDSQKHKIVTWVMDEEQQLKVMSIVGFGGLGKTTLANEVYREVGEKFNCKAIVTISQNPDIIKLLNGLMLRLGLQPCSHAYEPQDLIDNIKEYLQNKRYFIIIDDLWDIRAWNTISCAFPGNNHCSRVMITTRIQNVATISCGNHGFIYYMKPLSEQESRKLFFDRICESEDACPPDFVEVSCKILKKCGGLPLAIVTMASMIACQPTNKSKGQWAEYIQNSLGAEFATNPTYEDMMHIIYFSYKNLPHHLKACFLYLGTYPEDHKIRRVDLVRRWVAEGFVSCSRGQEVWNVAENNFNELVNRSMIQPAYEDDDYRVKVTHCRVHDMMLELILRKCREDNFICLIDGPEMMSEGQEKVVRRLSIDLRRGAEAGIALMGNTRHLSQVRSLNLFRGNCRVPNLAEFKFLRLLFLDVSNINTDVDLSGINHLRQLRYLKVIGTYGHKVLLPAQIRSLHALETLDLSVMLECMNNGIPELVDLPRLSHLSVRESRKVRLPDWIGKFKSLVTLSGFNLPMSSLENIKSLGELTALSELDFVIRMFMHSGGMMPVIAALITSLEKLGNLRNITMCSGAELVVYCGDAMLEPSFSPPFTKIVELNLGLLIFSRIPRWIGHLCCLHVLVLQAKEIHQEDFNVIGTRLTSLVKLMLTISRILTERIVIGGSTTGFNVLEGFGFDCDGVSCLTFEAGAMPNLEILTLAFDADGWDGAAPDGLQHLPSLKEIQLFNALGPATFAMRKSEEVRAMKALTMGVFQKASEALPTRPAVNDGGWYRRPKEMT